MRQTVNVKECLGRTERNRKSVRERERKGNGKTRRGSVRAYGEQSRGFASVVIDAFRGSWLGGVFTVVE